MTSKRHSSAEQWLLAHGGKEAVSAVLVGVILISSWFLYEMWAHDRKVLPAAAWAAWTALP